MPNDVFIVEVLLVGRVIRLCLTLAFNVVLLSFSRSSLYLPSWIQVLLVELINGTR